MGEIFRAHGPEYRARFAARMSADQLRAMRDIEACHTPAAGSALWRCPRCGGRHFTFLGCGNRHCPACGNTAAEAWLQKHSALLLPGVLYHLITFTVPEKLRRIIRSHPRELLELLMRTSASTLLDICANPRWIGGIPGATAVLHTWTRQYEYHPHVHFIATGGGLNPQGRWIDAHPRFLVPVPALSPVFRARFRDGLRTHHPLLFAQVPPAVWKQEWVVHSEPVGSGEKSLRYLARYVYRVALGESAILGHTDELITLRYRKSGTNQPRTLRLKPHEFLRRFLQHVLPSGFHKIRYYGLHHSSKRLLLRLLQAAMAFQARLPLPDIPTPPATPPPICEHCDIPMRFEARLPKIHSQQSIAEHTLTAQPRAPP
jgi:hypothetical protein